MEEAEHLIELIRKTKECLKSNNSIMLKDLSNQTIHSASTLQDPGSTTLAVIIYALSKLIERQDYKRISRWPRFVSKMNGIFDLVILAAKQNNSPQYETYLQKARKTLESISINLKPYIEEVLRKASINKASKIYEHGISMGQTARLLGVTQWELSEYTGQKQSPDPYIPKISAKERAEQALEFFS